MSRSRVTSRASALAIAVAAVLPVLSVHAAEDMYLKIDGISGESVDVQTDNSFDVQVCNDTFDPNLTSMQFDITYNPAVVNFQSASFGSYFTWLKVDSVMASSSPNTGGILDDLTVDYTHSSGGGAGTGTDMVDLQFFATENGPTDLGLESVQLYDSGDLVDPSTYTVDNSTTAEAVPEPATTGVLVLGAGAMLMLRKRRQRGGAV